jgi:hypothetical protein
VPAGAIRLLPRSGLKPSTFPFVPAYLLPIADREPLRWIVGQRRTALPQRRLGAAKRLRAGDLLFLYTTRGCFRNPGRDRGRIIGIATISGEAALLDPPMRFGSREYPIGVRFKLDRLAPFREGVEFAPLVQQLQTFPKPESWSANMRQALVRLDERDIPLLLRELEKVTEPYAAAARTYEPG